MKAKKEDKAGQVLRRISYEATKRFLPIIGEGGKGELLERVVKEKKPRLALEIGTLVGYSAIKIIRNLPRGSRLVTLEISPQTAAVARKNLEEAGMAEQAEIVVGSALKTIPKLKDKVGKRKFDFVFIDAAKDEYLDYLLLLEKNKLLDEKAVIVADNVKMFRDAVANYLDYMHNSGKYSSSYHDFGNDGVEVSNKL